MKSIALAAALAAAVPFLSGCGFTEKKASAEKVVDAYFAAMKKGDVEAALGLYSEKFFTQTPKEKWTATLSSVRTAFGKLTSASQKGFQVKKGTHEQLGSGYWVELTYETVYEKGEATEIFKCFEPSDGGGMQIVGQNFQPKGRPGGEAGA